MGDPRGVWSVSALVVATALAAAATPSVLQLAPPGEPGTPLVVHGLLRDAHHRPLAGAELHVYQTDATGSYTRNRAMDEPHARLSGRVRTDAAGAFELLTVRPAGYAHTVRVGDRDRHIPAHIHLDITARGHRERRLQVVFADDTLLVDPYWKDWVARLGQPVLTTHHEARGQSGRLILTLE